MTTTTEAKRVNIHSSSMDYWGPNKNYVRLLELYNIIYKIEGDDSFYITLIDHCMNSSKSHYYLLFVNNDRTIFYVYIMTASNMKIMHQIKINHTSISSCIGLIGKELFVIYHDVVFMYDAEKGTLLETCKHTEFKSHQDDNVSSNLIFDRFCNRLYKVCIYDDESYSLEYVKVTFSGKPRNFYIQDKYVCNYNINNVFVYDTIKKSYLILNLNNNIFAIKIVSIVDDVILMKINNADYYTINL